MVLKIKPRKKPQKSRKNPNFDLKDLIQVQDFNELIRKVSTINNFFYLDFKNNSNIYNVINDIPELEESIKELSDKVVKVRSHSTKTNKYGSLLNIGEYEISSLSKLRQLNSVHNMYKTSNYFKRIILILTEFKKEQFVVINKDYKLLKKEIFDLYDEVVSYFIDANVSWV